MNQRIAKHFFILILGLITMSISGCSSDGDEGGEDRPELKVTPQTLTLNAGEEKIVTIGGGLFPYSLSSIDTAIVTAELYGSTVKIKGISSGTTTFSVYDSDSKFFSVTVTVQGQAFQDSLQLFTYDGNDIRIDFSAIDPLVGFSGTLLANLPIQGEVPLVTENIRWRSKGNYTLEGSVQGVEGSTVLLCVKNEMLLGHIQAEGHTYVIRPTASNHEITTHDPNLMAPLTGDTVIPDAVAGLRSVRNEISVEDGSFIDILVLFTPQTQQNYSDRLDNLIRYQIDLTNRVFINSGIPTQLRLVHKELYNSGEILEGISPGSALDHIKNSEIIQNIRNQYQADIVGLLRMHPGNFSECGAAYLMTAGNMNAGFESNAFFVVELRDRKDAAPYYCDDLAFTHELAHILGCNHDREHANEPGAFSYSYGYNIPGILSTVMGSGSSRIDYFSSPAKFYQSYPIGKNIQEPDAAYNVMTLQNTRAIASNFRYNDLSFPPVADAGNNRSALPGDTVTLDGSNSTDSDDGIVSFQWEQISGTAIALSDDSAIKPVFNLPQTLAFGETLSFRLTVRDAGGLSYADECTIQVGVQNRAPVALADAYNIAENSILTRLAPGVLYNDVEPDGDSIEAHLFAQPDHGTLQFNNDGSFDYSPDLNFNGKDTFRYRAFDGFIYSEPVTVTITVIDINHAPVANPDAYETKMNTQLTIGTPGLLGNDTDSDNDNLIVLLVTPPENGTVELNSNGSFMYMPDNGFIGTDTFQYKAGDGFLYSDIVTVSVTVLRTEHPPVAQDDAFNGMEDTKLVIQPPGVLGNDTDSDQDSLKAELVSFPAHGSLVFQDDGSFEYMPAKDFYGQDTFSYKADDGTAYSNIATVAISIVGTNDLPAVKAGCNQIVKSGDAVVLDGSESDDADDGIESWLWEQIEGQPVALSDTPSDQASFQAPQVENTVLKLVFRLTVTDFSGSQVQGDCTVIVIPQSGFIKMSDGANIYYEAIGTGFPLILIHGSAPGYYPFEANASWNDQIQAFSDGFLVIRYDIRGFGKSTLVGEHPLSSWEWRTNEHRTTTDLKELMDYLNIGKAHLCGLSIGSAIAAQMSVFHPENVQKLIIASPWLGKTLPRSDSQQLDQLKSLILRTFFIGGDNDVQYSEELKWAASQGYFPNSETITNSGHFCNSDQPEPFNSLVKEWIMQP